MEEFMKPIIDVEAEDVTALSNPVSEESMVESLDRMIAESEKAGEDFDEKYADARKEWVNDAESLRVGLPMMHDRSFIERAEKAYAAASVSGSVQQKAAYKSILDQARWSENLLPLMRPVQGWPADGWKTGATLDKAYSQAKTKLSRSKKYVFPQVSGLAGKIASALPEPYKGKVKILTYRLWTLVAAKSLDDYSIFISQVIERAYRASKGSDPEFILIACAVIQSGMKPEKKIAHGVEEVILDVAQVLDKPSSAESIVGIPV
jgi:hypothetical protein